MSNFEYVNPNPKERNVGDCTVRAISLATKQSWGQVYLDLCIEGYALGDMPSSNETWGSYLEGHGWTHHRIPDTCPMCYTVNDFCEEHTEGTYIVATGTHVICVKDGKYLDTWDSGEKTPMFYYAKGEQ